MSIITLFSLILTALVIRSNANPVSELEALERRLFSEYSENYFEPLSSDDARERLENIIKLRREVTGLEPNDKPRAQLSENRAGEILKLAEETGCQPAEIEERISRIRGALKYPMIRQFIIEANLKQLNKCIEEQFVKDPILDEVSNLEAKNENARRPIALGRVMTNEGLSPDLLEYVKFHIGSDIFEHKNGISWREHKAKFESDLEEHVKKPCEQFKTRWALSNRLLNAIAFIDPDYRTSSFNQRTQRFIDRLRICNYLIMGSGGVYSAFLTQTYKPITLQYNLRSDRKTMTPEQTKDALELLEVLSESQSGSNQLNTNLVILEAIDENRHKEMCSIDRLNIILALKDAFNSWANIKDLLDDTFQLQFRKCTAELDPEVASKIGFDETDLSGSFERLRASFKMM